MPFGYILGKDMKDAERIRNQLKPPYQTKEEDQHKRFFYGCLMVHYKQEE